MENNISIMPYEGKGSFVFISYHEDDFDLIRETLGSLSKRGVRLWFGEGIKAGTERDEILAEHIEACEYFIAFISKKYLCELDCTDEANYARDINKTHLLAYLEPAELPAGMKMRFERTQSINIFEYSNLNALTEKLMAPEIMKKCYGVADKELHVRAEHYFRRLEELYPEHKIFGLEGISRTLHDALTDIFKRSEFQTMDQLYNSYGFSTATSEEVRNIRNTVMYSPGNEPDFIKPVIKTMLDGLEEKYPGKLVTDLASHKHLAPRVSALYRWLGYDSIRSMLAAYGFDYVAVAGRNKSDFEAVLKILDRKYAVAEKPQKMADLIFENPDLAAALKTFQNSCKALYGKTAADYLQDRGILAERVSVILTKADRRARAAGVFLSKFEIKDPEEYGRVKGLLYNSDIRVNKEGKYYIRKADECRENIYIPEGISFISYEAFQGNSLIRHVFLPDTLKEIQPRAFAGCVNLESVKFSEGIRSIEEEAFEGCTSLREVSLPSTLKTVKKNAFKDCASLESVYWGNPGTSVFEGAFDGCIFDIASLSADHITDVSEFEISVDRKNNAKITGYNGNDEYVSIPGSIYGHPVVSVEKGAFEGNETVLEISMSDNITNLAADVFKNCTNLKQIHLSENIAKLQSSAFSGCISLESVNIPDAVTDLKRGTFKDSPLKMIHIGKSIKKLDAGVFAITEFDPATGQPMRKCIVEDITVSDDNQFLSADGSCILSKDGKILYAELGTSEVYEVPDGVEIIAASAFSKAIDLKQISFPESLVEIGDKAFADSGVEAVSFGCNLRRIGAQAFSYCRSLKTAELEEGIEKIGERAFEGCPVKEVFIPASVNELGPDCFLALSNYKGEEEQYFSVDPENKVFETDEYAIYQKTDEGKLLLKGYRFSLTREPENENGLIPYSVAEGTTAISDYAFARCHSLGKVSFPASLNSIGTMAFWDCLNMSAEGLNKENIEIGTNAFLGTKIQ